MTSEAPRNVEPLARFMQRVSFTDTCWLWTGPLNYAGYGHFSYAGRRHGAHRAAYRLMRGPIPIGMEIDHVCRVRHCVNPAHLEVVSHRDNTLRGLTITAREVAVTHCPAGHPYSGDNLRMSLGKRYCRTCERRPRRQAA